jgi:hypothetical protein
MNAMIDGTCRGLARNAILLPMPNRPGKRARVRGFGWLVCS